MILSRCYYKSWMRFKSFYIVYILTMYNSFFSARSEERASLLEKIKHLSQTLSSKRVLADSLSAQMSSLVQHQNTVKKHASNLNVIKKKISDILSV